MLAPAKKLGNLCAVVDYNRWQATGRSDEIMALAPLADKWRAFGWNVIHVQDGHDFDAVINALEEAKAHTGQPTVVICETIKGKGVSYMENNPDFHGKAPDEEQTEQAYRELAD